MKSRKCILLILAIILVMSSALVLTACPKAQTVGKFIGLVASRREQTYMGDEVVSVEPFSASPIASFSNPFATLLNVTRTASLNPYGCTPAEQDAQFTNKNGTPYFAIENRYFYLIARFEISEEYDIRSMTVKADGERSAKRYQLNQNDENGVEMLSFYRTDEDWTTHAYLQFAVKAGERGVYEYEIGDVRCYRVVDNSQVEAFTVEYQGERTVKVDVRGYNEVEFVGQDEEIVESFLDEQIIVPPDFNMTPDGYRQTEEWLLNDEEVDLDDLKSVPELRLVAVFEPIEYKVYYHIPADLADPSLLIDLAALPDEELPPLLVFDEDAQGYVDEITLCFTFTVETGFDPEFDLENLFATPGDIVDGIYYIEYATKRMPEAYAYVKIPDFLRWVRGDDEYFDVNFAPYNAFPEGDIPTGVAEDIHFWAFFKDLQSFVMNVKYHILVDGDIFMNPDPKFDEPLLFNTKTEAQSYIGQHNLVAELEREPNLLPSWLWIDGEPTYGNPIWP